MYACKYICNGCNMDMSDLPDTYALSSWAVAIGIWAYISGKSQVPMLQLICNTF